MNTMPQEGAPAQTDALGNTARWVYNKTSAHPVRFITPKGEETGYTYDRVGRRMSIENAYGMVELSYNSRNFVTSRTDGEGYTSHTIYDRMGNMQAYYSPIQWETQGKGYEYKYDYLERVIDTITPLRSHERVFRSFDGDITREIHPVSYAEKGENGDGTGTNMIRMETASAFITAAPRRGGARDGADSMMPTET